MKKDNEMNYYNFKKILLGMQEKPMNFLSATVLGIVLITGGCKVVNKFETPEPAIQSINPSIPSPTPTLAPVPTMEETESLTPALTPIPSPTPTSTPEIVLSAKDDICRDRDNDDITDFQLRHEIAVGYLKINDSYGIILYEIASKGEICDYFTTKVLFKDKNNKYVPTDFMKEKGDAEFLVFDSIRLYMIYKLKMSEENAEKELAKIKKGKDLRTWYETFIPKNEQVIISWEELVGIKSTENYNEELEEQTRVLEKCWTDNNILV